MLSLETLSLAKAYTDKIKEQLSVGFTPEIVDSLPASGQNNILYLVLKENGQEEGNIYNEYIWIDNKYEFIGNTDTSFIVDNALSATSENPVQNKVIYNALNKKIEEPSGNGLVRKWMSGVYTTAGVDTTMPTSPTDNNVPTTKLLKDYVEARITALKLSVPIEISTDAEMEAVLTSDNVGKVYKFTGTSDTYTNGDLYVVEVG